MAVSGAKICRFGSCSDTYRNITQVLPKLICADDITTPPPMQTKALTSPRTEQDLPLRTGVDPWSRDSQ